MIGNEHTFSGGPLLGGDVESDAALLGCDVATEKKSTN